MKFLQNKSVPPKKGRAPELDNITVIASKGLGRVWHFNINFFLLLGILTLLLLYLAFSFMLLFWYFGEHHQKNVLLKLERDFRETQKALYQAKQRLKFLENYIDPSKIPAESPKQTEESQSASAVNNMPMGSGMQASVVRIKELKIDRRGTSLSVNFKLARASSGRSPIRGHIFVIAVDRSTNPPRLWPSPKADFENGSPVNPNKGQAYKIRNFRRIRVRWSFPSAEKTPSELRILVYDQSGGLLLKEDHPLEKDQTP
ncbi:MAG: hypothetical protein K9N10_02250 [Deltaproteobacteria bacterium]|nr:hypothetical protein [Deltaproteobacteria bacterium]